MGNIDIKNTISLDLRIKSENSVSKVVYIILNFAINIFKQPKKIQNNKKILFPQHRHDKIFGTENGACNAKLQQATMPVRAIPHDNRAVVAY